MGKVTVTDLPKIEWRTLPGSTTREAAISIWPEDDGLAIDCHVWSAAGLREVIAVLQEELAKGLLPERLG